MNIHDLINVRAALALLMRDDYELKITTVASEIYTLMQWDQPYAIMVRWDGDKKSARTIARHQIRGVLLRIVYTDMITEIKIRCDVTRSVRVVYPYDRRYFYV